MPSLPANNPALTLGFPFPFFKMKLMTPVMALSPNSTVAGPRYISTLSIISSDICDRSAPDISMLFILLPSIRNRTFDGAVSPEPRISTCNCLGLLRRFVVKTPGSCLNISVMLVAPISSISLSVIIETFAGASTRGVGILDAVTTTSSSLYGPCWADARYGSKNNKIKQIVNVFIERICPPFIMCLLRIFLLR